jgi:hypothetical protein
LLRFSAATAVAQTIISRLYSRPGARPEIRPCEAPLGFVLRRRVITGIIIFNGRRSSDGLPSPVPK